MTENSNKKRGWIKLYRTIQYSEMWPVIRKNRKRKYTELEAWIWLLLNANFSDSFCNDGVEVNRGQVLTSKRQLMQIFGWGHRRLNLFCQYAANRTIFTSETTTRYTLITICNYERYQGDGSETTASNFGSGNAVKARRKTYKNVKNVKNKKGDINQKQSGLNQEWIDNFYGRGQK